MRERQRMTVSAALFVTPPYAAERVTPVFAGTVRVVTVNVTVWLPAGTVTPGGTAAAVPLLRRATAAPPAGAGPVSVTVPVTGFPPETFEAESRRVERTGAFTVRAALFVTPPREAART